MSNTPVLNVREKLPDLEVLYQGLDIAKSGKTLSVLLVRVVNRGAANLLNTHYDGRAPVGIFVGDGTLIRGELSATSNDYLAKAARLSVSDSTVTFEPVILEPGEWFLVKLLVLHGAGTQPSVASRGKIAGMHDIGVVLPSPESDKEGFWYRVFSGSATTQLVRLTVYFVGGVLCVIAIIFPGIAISDYLTKKRRSKLVSRFKLVTKLSLHAADNYIFDGFIEYGLRWVEKQVEVVVDSDRLQKRVAKYLLRIPLIVTGDSGGT